MNWTALCLSTGIFLLACSAGYISTLQLVTGDFTWGSLIRDVLVCASTLALSVVMFDIAKLKPSRHHTFKSLLSQYLFIRILAVYLLFTRRRFQVDTDQILPLQEELLRVIIRHNENTKYGKDHKFNEIQGVDDFRSTHPLTDYSSYKDYITDILNGLDNVLFPEKVDFIATTSGTTSGKSKLIPKSVKALRKQGRGTRMLVLDTIMSLPDMHHLKFWHDVRIVPVKGSTKTGISRGAISCLAPPPFPFYVSPLAVYQIRTEPEALYLHALFGIMNEDVSYFTFMTTPFALNFMNTIERNWEKLCADVETGNLNPNSDIEVSLRLQIEKKLHKDPHRAEHLRTIFRQGFQNLVPRVWPSCKFIAAAATGSFSFATETLARRYLGGVRVLSSMHVSTESIYGIVLDPLRNSDHYTIVPTLNFYEFIPVEHIDDPVPATLLANEVTVDGEYEIVVTTLSGLYRYRTQDVVRVTGFKHQTPTYTFLQRAGDVLSANVDKYPEWLFTEAVTAAAETWTSCSLLNYIATENIHVERVIGELSGTCCYYIFIELTEDGSKVSQEDKCKIDECLMNKQEAYCSFRKIKHSLNPPVIIQVKHGSIQHVRDLLMRSNSDAVVSQYKYPRFTRKQEVLQYLLSHQFE